MKTEHTVARGFTLVEIMIVVAIIGLLATIAVPSYQLAREKARMTACISNLKLIDGAIQSWSLDMHKDSGQPVTFADISPYLGSPAVCPSGGTSFDDSYTITAVDAQPACQRRPEKHKLPPTFRQ